jgi:ABC-type polysaccharide/polyol phosphate export permease
MTGRLGRFVYLNPVSPILEALRLAAVDGKWPWEQAVGWNPSTLWWPLSIAVIGLPIAIKIFRRASTSFAELV